MLALFVWVQNWTWGEKVTQSNPHKDIPTPERKMNINHPANPEYQNKACSNNSLCKILQSDKCKDSACRISTRNLNIFCEISRIISLKDWLAYILLVAFLILTGVSLVFASVKLCYVLFPNIVAMDIKNLYSDRDADFHKSALRILSKNGIINQFPSQDGPGVFDQGVNKRYTTTIPTLREAKPLDKSQSNALLHESTLHQHGVVNASKYTLASPSYILEEYRDVNFDFKVLSYVNESYFAISVTTPRDKNLNEIDFKLLLMKDGESLPNEKSSPRISLTSFEKEFFVCEQIGDQYGIHIYQFLVHIENLSLDLEHNLKWKGKYEIVLSVQDHLFSKFILPTSFLEDPNQEFTVLTFGDMDVNWNSRETILNLLTELKNATKMIFHQGDIPYAWDGSQSKWEEWGLQVQPLTSHLFYQVGPGNHEKSSFCDFQSYEKRFSKWAGVSSHSNTNLYYSFDYLGIHWVSLSSEHDYTPGSVQYNWLIQDLKSVNRNKTPFVMAFAHRPMYSSNQNHGSDDKLREHVGPVLEEYKVDLALFGHVHAYERAQPFENGTVYVEVGTAGYDINPKWDFIVPTWSKYRETAHGFLKLTIVPKQEIRGTFYRNHLNGAEVEPISSDTFIIRSKYASKNEDPVQDSSHFFKMILTIVFSSIILLLLGGFFIIMLNSLCKRKSDNIEFILLNEFEQNETSV